MKGKLCLYIIHFELFVHILVNIIFKNHYMLIGKYISFIFLSLFVIKKLGVHADLSKMLKGCMTTERLKTPGLRSRPKQSNPFSTKPCLFLLTFSRWTLIHIKRTSFQSHTNNGFFKLAMLFYTVGCKTWASAEIFPGGAKSTFCSYFSGCWRCNANWRIQQRKCLMLRQQWHTVFSLYENFTPSKCLF